MSYDQITCPLTTCSPDKCSTVTPPDQVFWGKLFDFISSWNIKVDWQRRYIFQDKLYSIFILFSECSRPPPWSSLEKTTSRKLPPSSPGFQSIESKFDIAITTVIIIVVNVLHNFSQIWKYSWRAWTRPPNCVWGCYLWSRRLMSPLPIWVAVSIAKT